MTLPSRLNRRTALKVGIGTGIVSLLGRRIAGAEDSTSGGTPTTATQQPVTPRTDPVGGNIDTMVSELKAQIKTTYSTWEHDRFIEPAIRYFAQA
jgi:hypothetical protein